MKLAYLIFAFIAASIASAECPKIAGQYELVKEEQNVKPLLSEMELDKISPFEFVSNTTMGSFGSKITVTLRNGILNLGTQDVSFTLDGAEHMMSEEKSADNYFQAYKARCEGSAIFFEERGSNNNSDVKRVDTYISRATIRQLPNGHIVRELYGEQTTAGGKLARKGTIRQEFKPI